MYRMHLLNYIFFGTLEEEVKLDSKIDTLNVWLLQSSTGY